MDNIVGGRCSVSLITQLRRCIFSKNKNIFRHLKLEIALAIPASNDEKYNSNNSAGQGLKFCKYIIPLNKCTYTNMVYGEAGEIPLYVLSGELLKTGVD